MGSVVLAYFMRQCSGHSEIFQLSDDTAFVDYVFGCTFQSGHQFGL